MDSFPNKIACIICMKMYYHVYETVQFILYHFLSVYRWTIILIKIMVLTLVSLSLPHLKQYCYCFGYCFLCFIDFFFFYFGFRIEQCVIPKRGMFRWSCHHAFFTNNMIMTISMTKSIPRRRFLPSVSILKTSYFFQRKVILKFTN